MDTLERNQVRLIMEHLGSETLRKTADAQKALMAEHGAKGLLRSGATIKRAVAIIEDGASSYVEQAVDQVTAVAQDIDAFNVISASLTALFRGLEGKLSEAVRLASGNTSDGSSSTKSASDKLFFAMKKRIFNQLEIHRFSFVKPSPGDTAKMLGRRSPALALPTGSDPKRNPDGKTLAKRWDAMWADMAVQLWNGDLKPESQADIKRAMFDWLDARGIEVGDTAVTERARALWQRMEAED